MSLTATKPRASRTASVRFHDCHPPQADFLNEVLAGLDRRPRALDPKFFYDERGAQLFEAICRTPEYYPTRAEIAILERHGHDIARRIGPGCLMIEPGSGNGHKAGILIRTVRPRAYVPVDISTDYLRLAVERIVMDCPARIEVHAIRADYSAPLALPPGLPDARRVVFFPGSSVGNFEPEAAVHFLANLAQLVGPGGGLLIGVDLKKDAARLNAAYNDAQGVTAAFNLNLLARINRELGADFDTDRFRHRAFYDPDHGRIEMQLVCIDAHSVTVGGRRFGFECGESVRTEYSYKYTIEEFQALAGRAGFSPAEVWMDHERLFSVHYFTATTEQ